MDKQKQPNFAIVTETLHFQILFNYNQLFKHAESIIYINSLADGNSYLYASTRRGQRCYTFFLILKTQVQMSTRTYPSELKVSGLMLCPIHSKGQMVVGLP